MKEKSVREKAEKMFFVEVVRPCILKDEPGLANWEVFKRFVLYAKSRKDVVNRLKNIMPPAKKRVLKVFLKEDKIKEYYSYWIAELKYQKKDIYIFDKIDIENQLDKQTCGRMYYSKPPNI